MSKTPVVHAQQRWEYLYFSRKSEPALFNELLLTGQDGWELVNTHYFKDPKGVMTWIAFLKRPCGAAANPNAAQSKPAAASAPTDHAAPAPNQPQGFDLSGDVFEIKNE